MDYKSKLQILLQKSSSELPNYCSSQHNDVPPFKYSCKVTYKIKNDVFHALSNDYFESKKKAEQNAAHVALFNIEESSKNEYKIGLDSLDQKKIFVLIDYENYNDDTKIDKFKECNPQIVVTKYASIFNPRESTADIKVQSNRSDATDIKICCDVGIMFNTDINSIVYIITRDHFASCLSDLYKSCYHVVSIDQCFNEINMLANSIKPNEK